MVQLLDSTLLGRTSTTTTHPTRTFNDKIATKTIIIMPRSQAFPATPNFFGGITTIIIITGYARNKATKAIII